MLVLLLALAVVLASALPRTTVPFSYAWRFHFGFGGDDEGNGPGNDWLASFSPCTNSTNASDTYPDPHRMTQSDCATSCAYDPACYFWYHLDGSRTCTHGGAFAGCIPATDNATTNGGARTTVTPLQTAYSYGGATLPEASSWPLVDAPHDALYSVNGSFSESDGDERHGYRVRTVAWYRKVFTLPADWKSDGGITFLRFEGIVHFSQIYVNGVYIMAHASAYGEFTVRLDNVSGIVFGGGENVVAVRADASYGSEHWYGGGGLSRPVWLEHAPEASFVEHGVHVPPELPVGSMTVHARAEWQNFNPSEQTATVQFDVLDSSGVIIAQATSAPTAAPASAVDTVMSSADIVLPGNLTLWSAATPNLFTVICTLIVSGSTGDADSVNVTVGFRRTRWDADTGFYLNGLPLRQRGFSHHNSFAGVGVAMPQRLDLFRAQVGRSLGNNIWRMSHNPYRNGLYEVLDILGVMVWDENRDMGPSYAYQMGDMVKRGRNHASIVINSLCNEIECDSLPIVGQTMVALSKGLDPTRPTTANSDSADGLYAVIDVQGYSHKNSAAFEAEHSARPQQPLVLSECCSCSTQRLPRQMDAACMTSQNSPMDLPYVAGSLGVWTLFDYAGEPPGPWPYVSSSFGQIDYAGFPKPHAYWYTTQWRELSARDAGTAPLPPSPVVRILELLDDLSYNTSGLIVRVISSAAYVDLIVDGVSVGSNVAANGSVVDFIVPRKSRGACSFPVNATNVQCKGLSQNATIKTASACEAAACASNAFVWQFTASRGGGECWMGTPTIWPCVYNPNGIHWVGAGSYPPTPIFNATANARDAQGNIVASHTVLGPTNASSSAATTLGFFVDVPSPSTGTGSRLVLDGSDAALLRVATLDRNGALVSNSPVNITFTVTSGPGRISGVGNGDPTSHAEPNGNILPTFGGLARVIVGVTVDCVSDNRDIVRAVDIEGGSGIINVIPSSGDCPTEDIVVTASAPGFASVSAHIAVSGNVQADGVVASASAGRTSGAIDYIDRFIG